MQFDRFLRKRNALNTNLIIVMHYIIIFIIKINN